MTPRYDRFAAVIAAWRRKDVEAVLAAMTDDVVWHFAAVAAPPAQGKAAARKFAERFGATIGEVRWRIFAHAETADRLFVEGVDEYTGADGVDVAVPYAGVIEFRGDQICGWRDYVDMRTVERMKAGEEWPAHVRDLIAREAA